MSKTKKPGVLCEYCNSRLDRSEYYRHVCECEKQAKENRLSGMNTDQIIAHNRAMMNKVRANSDGIRQAYQNFDCK